MKLVAAKCPSCGADLEIDSTLEATKCKFCNSAILVEDALAKYKLEVSGSVEVGNMPKIDNLLKIANRAYESEKYEDAYGNYNKVIELDPDNTLALIRSAICKTLLNNFIDYSLENLSNSFDEVITLLNKQNTYEEKIEDYVEDVKMACDKSLEATLDYYSSYSVSERDLKDIHRKLDSILSVYEKIYLHTEKNKKSIANQIVKVIKNIISNKIYKSGTSVYGGNYLKSSELSSDKKSYYVKKLEKYSDSMTLREKAEVEELKNEDDDSSRKSSRTVGDKFLDSEVFNKNFKYIVIFVFLFEIFNPNPQISGLIMSILSASLILAIQGSDYVFYVLLKGNTKIIKFLLYYFLLTFIFSSLTAIFGYYFLR